MRLFGSERVMGMMENLGVDEDTPIEQKMLTSAIESAQRQVESRNFQVRKSTLEYDDVMNTQRKVIYKERQQVLNGEDMQQSVQRMLSESIQSAVSGHIGESAHLTAEDWRAATAHCRGVFLAPDELKYTDEELAGMTADELCQALQEKADARYAAKEREVGEALMREVERVMLLRVVDEYWMDHIDAMQELRRGIGLRAYGQSDPIVEYKREGYEMFEEMIAAIQEETVRRVFLVRLQQNEQKVERKPVAKITGTSGGGDGTVQRRPVERKGEKIGRNDPCPCGSGKKWKKCTCKEYHSEADL